MDSSRRHGGYTHPSSSFRSLYASGAAADDDDDDDDHFPTTASTKESRPPPLAPVTTTSPHRDDDPLATPAANTTARPENTSTAATVSPTPAAVRLSDNSGLENLHLRLAEERRKLMRALSETDAARALANDFRRRVQQLESAAHDRDRTLTLIQQQLTEATTQKDSIEAQLKATAAEAHSIVGQWQVELQRARVEHSRAVERASRLEDELAAERAMHAHHQETHRAAIEEAAAARTAAEKVLKEQLNTAAQQATEAAAERDRLLAQLSGVEGTCQQHVAALRAMQDELSVARSEAQREAAAAAEARADTARWKTDCLEMYNVSQQQRALLASEAQSAAQAEARASELAAGLEATQKVLHETREALSSVEAERVRLERLVDDLHADREELRTHVTKAQRAAEEYMKALDQKDEELTLFAAQQSARVATVEAERATLAEETARLKADMAGLNDAVSELSALSAHADARVTAAEERAHRHLQDLVQATAEWQSQESTLTQQLLATRLECSQVHVALEEDLTRRAVESDATAALMAAVSDMLPGLRIDADEQRKHLKALLAHEKAQNNVVKADNAELRDALQDARTQIEAFASQLQTVRTMHAADVQRLTLNSSETARRAAEQLADAHTRHEALKNELEALTLAHQALNQRHTDLCAALDAAKGAVATAHDSRARSVDEYERRLQQESADASKRLAIAHAEAAHLAQQLEVVTQGHRDVTVELSNITAQCRAALEDRDAARVRLEETTLEHRHTMRRISELESALIKNQTLLDDAEGRTATIQAEYAQAIREHRGELSTLRQQHTEEVTSLRSAVTSAQSGLEHATRVAADARSDRDAARARVAEVTAECQDHLRTISELEKKIHTYKEHKTEAKAALAEWRAASERQRCALDELRADRDRIAAERDRVAAKYNTLYEEKSAALGSSWRAQQEAQARSETLLRQLTEMRGSLAEHTTLAARQQRLLKMLEESNAALKAALKGQQQQRGHHQQLTSDSGHPLGRPTSVSEAPLNVTEGPRRHPKRRSSSTTTNNTADARAQPTPSDATTALQLTDSNVVPAAATKRPLPPSSAAVISPEGGTPLMTPGRSLVL